MQRSLLSYYIIVYHYCQGFFAVSVTVFTEPPTAGREARADAARTGAKSRASDGKPVRERERARRAHRTRSGRYRPGRRSRSGSRAPYKAARTRASEGGGGGGEAVERCYTVTVVSLCIKARPLASSRAPELSEKSIPRSRTDGCPSAAQSQSRRGARARRSDHAVTEYTPSTARQRCAKHGAHGVKCAAERPERARCAEGVEQRTTAARTEGQSRARR